MVVMPAAVTAPLLATGSAARREKSTSVRMNSKVHAQSCRTSQRYEKGKILELFQDKKNVSACENRSFMIHLILFSKNEFGQVAQERTRYASIPRAPKPAAAHFHGRHLKKASVITLPAPKEGFCLHCLRYDARVLL